MPAQELNYKVTGNITGEQAGDKYNSSPES